MTTHMKYNIRTIENIPAVDVHEMGIFNTLLFVFIDEPGGHRGLSMRPDHYRKRTECLNKFATFYDGRLPLHYSFLRVFYDASLT